MLYFLSYEITKFYNRKNDLQPHSRSVAVVPFDMPYMISYYSSIVIMEKDCQVGGLNRENAMDRIVVDG